MIYEDRATLQFQINQAASELLRILTNAGISEHIIDSIDYDVSLAVDEIWEKDYES